MEISDSVLLAIVSAVPTTLAALGALFVSLRNGHKADVTQTKIDAVDVKATEIHMLTNSNLARVTSQLEVANTKLSGFAAAQEESVKKIAGLERLVADFMARGNIQAVADADRVKMIRSSDVPAAAPITAALESLDTRSARIETKVDVVVDKVTPKPP